MAFGFRNIYGASFSNPINNTEKSPILEGCWDQAESHRKSPKRCFVMAQQGWTLSEAAASLGVKSVKCCSLIYIYTSVFFHSFCFFRGVHIVLDSIVFTVPMCSTGVGLAQDDKQQWPLQATSGMYNDLCFVHTGGFTFPKPRWTASTVTIMWKRVMVKRETNS